MQVIRTVLFERSWKALGLNEQDYEDLASQVLLNPHAGLVIPGLRGVRKLRFSIGNKGKRGGGRCVYLVMAASGTIYLLLVYSKSQREDLSQSQRAVILSVIEELE